MKNKQGVKLFIVLFLCTFFIFGFSHFGALAYNTYINQDNSFSENTTIGTVNIAGKEEAEAMQAVDEQLTNWLDKMTVYIVFKESRIQLDNRLFRFDVESSVKTAVSGQKNLLLVHFEENTLENALIEAFPTIDSQSIVFDKLKTDLLKSAKLLQVEQVELRLEDYFTDSNMNADVLIHEIQLDTDGVNLGKLISELSKFEIPARSQFSLLNLIEEKGLQNESAKTLNVLASGIYQLILPSNFTIIERNIGNEQPDYSSLGFEAKLDVQKNIDFIFANPNETPYVIQLDSFDNTLILSLKGKSFLNKYVVVTKDEQSFKPKIIKQFNSLLKPGEKVVERQGRDGMYIKVIREIYDEKGSLLRSEAISEDFYPPLHQIEVHSLETNDPVDTTHPPTESTESTAEISDPTGDDQEAIGEVIESNSDLWGKPNEQMK